MSLNYKSPMKDTPTKRTMVLVRTSSKISIPPSLPPISSLEFEPNSLSLALTHSDSSLSLFPSLPFPSLSSLPPKPPQTLIPSPSSSSSFLLLQHDPQEPNKPRVLFLVAGPHKGGSQVLLRFFILRNRSNFFVKAQVFSNQKGIGFDPKLGVLLDVDHGVSIKVVGSVNFFVVYSVSSMKVSVFGVKLFGDGDVVKLMRCAVIECCGPVWSICISFGCLILGEDGGVRIFNLRQLVKGKVKRIKGSSLSGNSDLNGKLEGKGLKLPNGVIGEDNDFNGLRSRAGCNGFLEGKIDRRLVSSKQRSVKCREDSVDVGACFLEFKRKEITNAKSTTVKIISIQPLTQKKFIILDSSGDLHILDMSDHAGGLNINHHMSQFLYGMKVEKMAVLTDPASKTHIVWLSDGFHSVHKLSLLDADAAVNKGDENDRQDELMEISVIQAIFTAEQVWDLVPVGVDVILILSQGNIYAYAIP